MRWFLALVIALTGLLPSVASGEECDKPDTCVAKKDLDLFLKMAREKMCLIEDDPTFDLDPVNIVIDREGRVFFSGAEPHPYTLRMTWCDYEIEAKGKVNIITAMRKPDIWGFRFRPKSYISALPFEAFYADPVLDDLQVHDLIDAGVMVDFFYYDWFNVNAAVGFRSLGGGLGFDLTANFGAYAGYGLSWGEWNHNLNLGLWFSFWNPE